MVTWQNIVDTWSITQIMNYIPIATTIAYENPTRYLSETVSANVISNQIFKSNLHLLGEATSWLPSKKESNTWGAIFPSS